MLEDYLAVTIGAYIRERRAGVAASISFTKAMDALLGIVGIIIAGVVLLVLKIFRVKHDFDVMEMAGFVVVGLIGLCIMGVILYCFGIALGICRPLCAYQGSPPSQYCKY
jgi:hypothetical protein